MNLFELSAILTLNTTAYKQGLQDAEAQASGSRLGSIFSTIGSVAAGGLSVAVGAVGSLTKAATDSYADYEQLKGGVETLFGTGGQSLQEYAQSVGLSVSEAEGQYDRLKTAEQLVMENADKAFKTAGLSANDYMEQATSTAAALISSLDGDTVQAAKLADQAITDMSDNANKMGTNIESIQNAYGGFAKGNFTMLDNLKLGYGGTKEEMQRLLNKAEEISGYKYDISSYSDIVEAIHVVQEEMGITGTTMKEAEGTINGSLSMVKASWKDLLTSFGRGGEETKKSIANLVESCSSYLQNIIPVISEILVNIGEALPEIVPIITEQIPILISELLPPLIKAAWSLATSIIKELPTILGSIFDTIANLFMKNEWTKPVGEAMLAVKETISKWMDIIGGVLETAWDGIKTVVEKVWEVIKTIIGGAFDVIKSYWNNVLAPVWDTMKVVVSNIADVFKTTWEIAILPMLKIVWKAIEGIWDNILKPVFDAIVEVLDIVYQAFHKVWEKLIAPLITGVFETIKKVWETILKAVFGDISTANEDMEKVFDAVWGAIGGIVEAAFEGISWVYDHILAPVFSAIGDMLEWLQDFWDDTFGNISDTVGNFLEYWDSAFGTIGEIASDILGGVAETISDAWEAVKGFAGKIKSAFNGGGSSSGYLSPYDVEWHAKANNQPYMFSGATLFGAGESGDEILYGRDSLMNDIRTAVSGGSNNDKLYNLLAEYLPEILDRSSKEIVLDDGTLVGRMDRRMGYSANAYRRGV